MANYAKMARDSAERRKDLERELEKARKTVKECEKELAVLSQIIGALKGVGAAGTKTHTRCFWVDSFSAFMPSEVTNPIE